MPALSKGRGHSPVFTMGDVLACAVLKRLTAACGVRIGHLSEIATAIFETCNSGALDALEHQTLVINLQAGTCAAVGDLATVSIDEPVVLCPMASVVRTLQRQLLNPPARTLGRRAAQPRSAVRSASQ
jgi:hypothetical protein